MIKIEDVEVIGMRKAIKGMRNAMNSWDKSDSKECGLSCITSDVSLDDITCNEMCGGHLLRGYTQIGKEDMKLCKRLIKAGSPDRKFMRMIHVQADVTAPIYWWKEYDTYKVGTTSNSCSTMHTIHKKELTLEDFSLNHLTSADGTTEMLHIIGFINDQIKSYNRENETMFKKNYWWNIIQTLPSSFNQMRTIDLDYETLFSIYHQRKNHKLTEWREFCDWITTLPYMKEFLGLEETNDSREAD